jgi:hypothetical protein
VILKRYELELRAADGYSSVFLAPSISTKLCADGKGASARQSKGLIGQSEAEYADELTVVQTVLEAKAAQETQFTSVIEGFSFSLLL